MRPHAARARSATPPPLPPDSLAAQLTVAAQAVARVCGGQALNDGLTGLWQAHPELPPASRAAVQDLVFGTLRDFGRAETMFAALLRAPLTAPEVDALLRVALHRLEQRPDTAHTVVDQAVEAAARMVGGGLKSLVNGVLRNALRQWDALRAACERQETARWRHPDWWVRKVEAAWPQDWQRILDAGNSHPPMSLRVNRRRASASDVIATLGAAGHQLHQLSEHALRLEKPVPVAVLPGFAEGLLSVQDWGAQQAALLLGATQDMRVLDACAAPGGKTAHVLELADVGMLALDSEPARAHRITDTLSRLGLAAEVRTADARDSTAWWDGRTFDRILADVPCSASGVVRRHPDIKWLRRSADVARFATLQAEILDAVWPTLASGGKMLYVTCSVFPEENGRQVARFASRHADCQRVAFEDGTTERQWLPCDDHDGFFFALLEKR